MNMEEAKNLKAIKEWVRENRPDCLPHMDQLAQQNSMILIMTIRLRGRSRVPAEAARPHGLRRRGRLPVMTTVCDNCQRCENVVADEDFDRCAESN